MHVSTVVKKKNDIVGVFIAFLGTKVCFLACPSSPHTRLKFPRTPKRLPPIGPKKVHVFDRDGPNGSPDYEVPSCPPTVSSLVLAGDDSIALSAAIAASRIADGARFSLHPDSAPVYFRGHCFGGLLDLRIPLCYKRRSTVIVNANNIYEATSALPSRLTARVAEGIPWIRVTDPPCM